jgi:acyl carrier protein
LSQTQAHCTLGKAACSRQAKQELALKLTRSLGVDAAAIYQKLTPIFQNILDDNTLVLGPGTSARDVPSWDSVNHIRIVLSIEQQFGLKIKVRETAELMNVGDLVEFIQKKSRPDAV